MARGYLFVPHLTPLSLFWARILAKPSAREIVYLRLAESLKPETARDRLDSIGARAFSFEDCDAPEIGYYYGDKPGIATAVADRLADTACFHDSSALYAGIPDHAAKLRIVLRSYVDQECFELGHILAWLRGQKNPGASWVLAPMGYIRRRYLAESGLDIRPCPGAGLVSLLAGLGALGTTARRILGGLHRRGAPAEADGKPVALPGRIRDPAAFPAKVLFFPHQTVSYGGLFFKNQFYSDEPDSPFHPSRIHHVELQPPRASHISANLVGFHEAHDIHWSVLPLSTGRRRLRQGITAFREVWRTAGLSVLRSRTQRVAFSIMGRARWQFLRYGESLAVFPDAEIALIGYEILTPKLLYLALEAREIRTVASQERFHAPIFFDNWNFILDTYFTGSDAVSDFVRQSRFKYAANPVAVGQVRTDLLVRYRETLSRSEVLPESDAFDRVVLVFDPPGFADPDVARMMYVANRRSNLAFYGEVIALAERFPETLFVIRSKDLQWTRVDDFRQVLAAIDRTPNLVISRDYETPACQYRLASIADLVIAKYTSIGDECMGLGIPVVFHDYTPNLVQSAHRHFDYAGLPVFVHDFDSLVARTEQVLSRGHYLEPDDIDRLARLVNGRRADGRVHARIRQHLSSLLETGTPDAQAPVN